jgi:acetone carboxylase gamma subunit
MIVQPTILFLSFVPGEVLLHIILYLQHSTMVHCECGFEVCEFEENTDLFLLIKETAGSETLVAKARWQEVCPKF